jgi:hypothetical protein
MLIRGVARQEGADVKVVLDYDEHGGDLPGYGDVDETLNSDVLPTHHEFCAVWRVGLGHSGVDCLR